MCPLPVASLITHTSSRRFRPDAYAPSATTLIQRLCFPSSSVTHLVRCVEGFLQRLKRLEAIQVSRDEFAFASVDVRERTEAVVFQLKDIIGIVKGLRYQPEPQRVSAW